jgi:hypothetical protein
VVFNRGNWVVPNRGNPARSSQRRKSRLRIYSVKRASVGGKIVKMSRATNWAARENPPEIARVANLVWTTIKLFNRALTDGQRVLISFHTVTERLNIQDSNNE